MPVPLPLSKELLVSSYPNLLANILASQPIMALRKKKTSHSFLIKSELNSMGGKPISSFTGRKTIIQSTSTPIVNYYAQCLNIPSFICNGIDKEHRNFLWGSHNLNRKIHLVQWDDVTKPKRREGVGLR